MESQANPALKSRKLYLPTGIVQRDGQRAAFEIRRIADTLSAAGQRTGAFDEEEACVLTQRVLRALRQRFPASEPTSGEIRDLIEQILAARVASPATSSVRA
jgi:hypothetical protein